MDVNVSEQQGVKVIAIVGELDSKAAPIAQERVLAIAADQPKMALDMSQVAFMSSAGLRMLLSLYRAISGHGGKVVLVGLSTDLKDTMSMTGFLDFFAYYDTLADGLAALGQA
jgi:anti-sigma B factor antagonist